MTQQSDTEKGADKVQEAVNALAAASTLLRGGKLKRRWYDCNKLYHGAVKLLDELVVKS